MLPGSFFELRHDFLNTRAAVGLFSGVFKGLTWLMLCQWAFPDIQNDGRSSIPFIYSDSSSLDVTKQISPAEEFLRPRLDGIWWLGGLHFFVTNYWLLCYSFSCP